MDPGAELIARMKDGDEAAIEAFVRQYYPSILRYCRCHTKDTQQAEDLTQETFEHFFRSLTVYRHRGKLANYLYVIAGNLCRDSLRKGQQKSIELPETIPEPDADIDQRLSIHQAVGRLPVDVRKVIVLHYFAGLALREIAKAEGISLPLVKYRLRRGKVLLRIQLKEEFP